MNVVVTGFAVVAAVAWLSAFTHGIWSLGHLSGKSSLGQMIFNGIRWFDAENFTPRGRVLQKRFGRSFIAFMLCVFGLVLAAVAQS